MNAETLADAIAYTLDSCLHECDDVAGCKIEVFAKPRERGGEFAVIEAEGQRYYLSLYTSDHWSSGS